MTEKFISAMKRFNAIVKEDIKNKLYWMYYNTKRSEPTFEATRKAGKRWTNCMGGVAFALKDAGVPGSALDWYGGKGKIVWLNDKAEANCRKYFEIIKVKTKTVKQCIDSGILQPGDVVTYMTITHTNAFLGDGKSYDTGHAYCIGSGEGAKYRKWIGDTPYKGYKVAYILRLKKKTVYRVQIEADKKKENADRCAVECQVQTGYGAFVELMSDKLYHVFCGSFTVLENAEYRKEQIEGAYPKAFVKKVEV